MSKVLYSIKITHEANCKRVLERLEQHLAKQTREKAANCNSVNGSAQTSGSANLNSKDSKDGAHSKETHSKENGHAHSGSKDTHAHAHAHSHSKENGHAHNHFRENGHAHSNNKENAYSHSKENSYSNSKENAHAHSNGAPPGHREDDDKHEHIKGQYAGRQRRADLLQLRQAHAALQHRSVCRSPAPRRPAAAAAGARRAAAQVSMQVASAAPTCCSCGRRTPRCSTGQYAGRQRRADLLQLRQAHAALQHRSVCRPPAPHLQLPRKQTCAPFSFYRWGMSYPTSYAEG
ncbi:hypothetical protein ACJJTC_006532 [Scirpophaga incertulas]